MCGTACIEMEPSQVLVVTGSFLSASGIMNWVGGRDEEYKGWVSLSDGWEGTLPLNEEELDEMRRMAGEDKKALAIHALATENGYKRVYSACQ